MQGQGNTIDSSVETVDIDQGSSSNNSGRLHSGHNSNQVRSGPLLLQDSSSNHVLPSVNANAGHISSANCGQSTGVSIWPNHYDTNRSEMERRSSATSCSNGGPSPGSSSHVLEENAGGSGSSLGTWGLSCKRKALEGTSGQSYSGDSTSFTQAENGVWHTGPARYDASGSLSLSTPLQISPSICPPDQQTLRIGVGIRGLASDAFPSSATENAESSGRNFARRVSPGQQQESVQFNLSSVGATRHSNVSSLHQSTRSVPFSDSLDLRSTTAVAANSTAAEGQPHTMHISALSRNMHPFPWNGTSSSRAGTNNLILGERDATLWENATVRGVPRSNAEYPMFASATEMRTAVQDPANWSVAPANISASGGVPSAARFGASSSTHPLPTPAWFPPTTSTHNQQRLPEFAPWSLFPLADSESAGHGGPFPPLPAGPSVSSIERVRSSGSSSQTRRQHHRRSALLLERQVDDVLGVPHSFRAFAADIEERHRLISEIRQVLNAMRRGENLRPQDYILFDPFIYNGVAQMHDRHRDMRLDVDNMSYEELLALEERIGDVNTGLSEETILKVMKQRKYFCSITKAPVDVEPCCICQEEYVEGDDVGTLDCSHDFHTDCIKQWLMQKNLCPICKTEALNT